MNSLASFGLCKLSDEELLNKVDSLTDQLFEKQKIPDRHIPARPESDYDLLIGELLLRFKKSLEKKDKRILVVSVIEGSHAIDQDIQILYVGYSSKQAYREIYKFNSMQSYSCWLEYWKYGECYKQKLILEVD